MPEWLTFGEHSTHLVDIPGCPECDTENSPLSPEDAQALIRQLLGEDK